MILWNQLFLISDMPNKTCGVLNGMHCWISPFKSSGLNCFYPNHMHNLVYFSSIFSSEIEPMLVSVAVKLPSLDIANFSVGTIPKSSNSCIFCKDFKTTTC